MPAFSCVTLDIDDTLYLERDYVRSGFRAAGLWAEEKLGLAGFSAQAWALFEGGARGNIFDLALRECGVSPEPALITALVGVYREHAPDIALLPDARVLIEELHERVALACVTDGPLQSQEAKAHALGLSEWVSPIVFTARWGTGFGKPHPRSFEHIQVALGAEPSRCVYVADNPLKDFMGPKSLGWRTVRIRRALSLHSALESGTDVDHEVESLESLHEWFGFGSR